MHESMNEWLNESQIQEKYYWVRKKVLFGTSKVRYSFWINK